VAGRDLVDRAGIEPACLRVWTKDDPEACVDEGLDRGGAMRFEQARGAPRRGDQDLARLHGVPPQRTDARTGEDGVQPAVTVLEELLGTQATERLTLPDFLDMMRADAQHRIEMVEGGRAVNHVRAD